MASACVLNQIHKKDDLFAMGVADALGNLAIGINHFSMYALRTFSLEHSPARSARAFTTPGQSERGVVKDLKNLQLVLQEVQLRIDLSMHLRS